MLVDLTINGLVQGSLLALICIGYSLAYGSARVINFAHVDVMLAGGGYLVLLWIDPAPASTLRLITMTLMFGVGFGATASVLLPDTAAPATRRLLPAAAAIAGGLATWLLAGRIGFSLAVLLALPWTAALATAVYRIGYLPLLRRDAAGTSLLLTALGLSIAIQSLLSIAWGSTRRVFPAGALPQALAVSPLPPGVGVVDAFLHFGMVELPDGIRVPVHDFLIVATFLVVAAAVAAFFKYSVTAHAIIATADSKVAARACGIPVDRVIGQAFLLGGAVAASSGTLFVIRSKSFDPTAGFTTGLLAFAACVLGGIGSIRGSIAGAFFISLVTSLAPAVPLDALSKSYVPGPILAWLPSMNMSDLSYGVVYVLLILVILKKPEGLFAQ